MRYFVRIGDEERVAEPGDLVFKPRGVPHSFWNAGDDWARALELISPAGFERFFRELDGLGATREASAASALLRSLGGKSRAGPRARQLLTHRETEVLHLLGEGLSKAEIASRLYISPKTAEHHVGRILQKLDLRSRAEAAAFAVRTEGVD